MAKDARQTVCSVNSRGTHKWTRATKDVISKSQFVHMLRCRYCATYVGIEFNRVLLPSGRVEVTQRVFAIKDATPTLREEDYLNDNMKHIDLPTYLIDGFGQPHAIVANGSSDATGKQ